MRAKKTEAMPTPSEMRAPCMMVDRMSRPWLSVPSGYWARPFSSQAGGVKASLRFSAAMLNGSCGADADERQRRGHHRHGRAPKAPGEVVLPEPAENHRLLDRRESRLRPVV